MRSELVFSATTHVSNRFMLTGLAAKAVRRFHRPNTRIQKTANDVLVRFSRDNPIAVMASERDQPSFRLPRAS